MKIARILTKARVRPMPARRLSLLQLDQEGTQDLSTPIKQSSVLGFGSGAKRACLAACLGFVAMTPAAQAQQASNGYVAGAERIDLSDRVRMNSQRIAAMSCMIDAGANVDENRAAILEAMTEVDGLLAALKDGDTDLNVTVAESDRKMLTAIRGVSLQWELFRDALDLRLTAGAQSVGPDYVSRQNLNLMHASKYLVSEAISAYAIPPALLQNDAFTLQIVARQRTLAQQIAKETCGVLTGNNMMGNEKRLANSTRRFDASFNALVNGFPAAGVSAPATDEIKAGLAAMKSDWAELQGALASVDADADPAQAGSIVSKLDSLMVQFDALVPLYVEESKSGL